MEIKELRQQMQEQLKQDEIELSQSIADFLDNFTSGDDELVAAKKLLAENLKDKAEMMGRYIGLLEADGEVIQ